MNRVAIILVTTFFFLHIQASEKDTINTKNEIAFVVSELIDGGFHIRYERKLKESFSLGISSSWKSTFGVINRSGLQGENLSTSDINYTGFKIVPDFRYYLPQTQRYGMDGFYVGLYSKFTNYKSNIFGTYTDNGNQNYSIDADLKFKIFSIGFMAGYKLALSEKFNIDFIILGPGSSFHDYSLKNNVDLPDQFYEDLNQVLENYSLNDFLNGDIRFTAQKARAKFILPSFRYGITVGYCF